jgi:hypothetical protein
MFKSNQELLQATRDLTAALEKHGNASAARELRDGMAAINGLTDGWAAFLESVQRQGHPLVRARRRPAIAAQRDRRGGLPGGLSAQGQAVVEGLVTRAHEPAV